MPKVSIVMPAYNAEKYIGEAIESVLNQTFKDFEFIIINDGSTDKTKTIIQTYDDPRIVYLENEENSGIVVTLNKGLENATGEYIARMDADDISVKERLEKQVNYLDKNKEVGVLGTGICVFGENMEPQKRVFMTDCNLLKAELIFNSCIAHPTVMMRREVLNNHNLCYNEKFAGREDFALWWEVAKVSKIETLPEILLYYRSHQKQVTKNNDYNAEKNAAELLNIRMKDIGVGLSPDEFNSILKYCRNQGMLFKSEECVSFIDGLSKIIKINKKNCFFDQKALKHVLGLSVTFSRNNANFSADVDKQLFKYAIKKRVYSIEMTMKLLYYRFFVSRK